MIKCPKCGKELPDGTAFCLECFSSLAENTQEIKKDKPNKKPFELFKSRQFKVACSAVAVLAVAITGAVLMKKYIKPSVKVAADDTTLVEVTDENGEAVTDENGEAVVVVAVEVTDKGGEAVTNSDGTKKLQQVVPVTDKSGETVTSKDGQQVFEVVAGNNGVSASSPETTAKKSVIDRIIGGDKDKSTGESSTALTNPVSQTGTTENVEISTEKAESTAANSTTQPVTQSTTQTASSNASDDFEYVLYNGYIKITKYKGTAANVVVPDKINGTAVGYIESEAFLSNIKTITFNSTIYSGFTALNKCTDLEAVYVNGSDRMKSVDGVVFYSDNSLYYYPVGKKTADYVLPSFCTRLSQNSIRDNPYIKTFTFSAENNGQYPWSQAANFMGCSALTAINTSKNTNSVKSIDGVLYFTGVGNFSTGGISINNYTQFIFPAGKQADSYEFPAEFEIYIDPNSFCGNKNITSAKFRNRVAFNVAQLYNSKYAPKNLKKLYFLDNEEQHAFYNSNEYVFKSYKITVEYY